MMKLSYIAALLLLLTALFHIDAAQPSDKEREIKLLVLIIASDNYPVYLELQKNWRAYMHLDPKHVEVYFIKGDLNISGETEIDGDIIWSKTDEGWAPASAGIMNKTIMSMEAMLPRLDEFDYVLRTNLSSFYIFPRLLKVLKTLPKTGVYFASPGNEKRIVGSPYTKNSFGHGCGIILSPDVVRMLIDDKDFMIGNIEKPDDLLIFDSLKRQGIPLMPHKRMDFLYMVDWLNYRDKIPRDIFHIRAKSLEHERRLKDDTKMHNQLRIMFYPETQ